MAKRILVIGMADSVHLARWLAQFSTSEYTFRIVSSSPHRRLHPGIKRLLLEGSKFHIGTISRFLSLPLWMADRLFSDFFRGILIAFEANRFRPDLVHILRLKMGAMHSLGRGGCHPCFQIAKQFSPLMAVIFIGSRIYLGTGASW